jgi:DNA modification methylase
MKVLNHIHAEQWSLYHGDSAVILNALPESSVDLTLFSIPFGSLFTYSASERDLGNCRSDAEFFAQYGYISRELLRVIKPGRQTCVHVMNLATTLASHGVIGIRDFRGAVIAHMVEQGFIYHGEWTIQKDPQGTAIRTHAKGLLFVQLERDAAWMRPAIPDNVLVFRKPGQNAVPVRPDVTRDEWIKFAHPVWTDIRETHTLNAVLAREAEDERHLCPLAIDTVERLIRLYSNRGETVLDPFNGIGTSGHVALSLGRRYIGIELKESYYRTAARYLSAAAAAARAGTLFDSLDQEETLLCAGPELEASVTE